MLGEETARVHPMERLSLDRETFERMHKEDQMASDLLSQGIEGFSNALKELESLLADRLSALGADQSDCEGDLNHDW